MPVRFLVVDALNLIRRVHAATPGGEDEALESTLRSLRRALDEHAPTHAVAVFDGSATTWRHRLFPDYKAGRKPMPEPLRDHLARYRERFQELGVLSVQKDDLEADDLIATLATKVATTGGHAIILSTDTIFCQLLSDRITVRDHFQKRDLDRAHVLERLGVAPDRLADLWGLAGNATTNIPGVPRVGVKTAAKLLDEHGELEAVLKAAGAISGKLGESLRDNAERALLSRELARLREDLELGWNLRDFVLARRPPR